VGGGHRHVTDAGFLAEHLLWAATPHCGEPGAQHRQRCVSPLAALWPRLARPRWSRRAGPFDGEPAPLEQQMADAAEVWPISSAVASQAARPRC
jgi:hypothetical protein